MAYFRSAIAMQRTWVQEMSWQFASIMHLLLEHIQRQYSNEKDDQFGELEENTSALNTADHQGPNLIRPKMKRKHMVLCLH